MSQVRPGDWVKIHYTTLTGDECVLETSAMREPLEMIAGSADVIAGISAGVVGMQPGDRKRIHVPPEQAFGFRDPRLQQTVPRLAIPDRMSDGDQLAATLLGQQFPIWIRSFEEDEVTLDANHPLAGESLVIDLELVGIGREDTMQSRNERYTETTP